MIKQLLLLVLFIFLLGSCKKKFTCECTTVVVYQSAASGNFVKVTSPGNNIAYSEKLTQKQADAACKHEGSTIQTNLNDWNTSNGTYVYKPGESLNTTCILH